MTQPTTANSDPKPTPLQLFLRAVLVIAVLVLGIVSMAYFVKTRAQPKKVSRQNTGALVEVVTVYPRRQDLTISAHGQVIPAQQVAIIAEVGGRVVWINDELVPGGRIHQGQNLIRVDARDYNLAVEQQLAQVESALTALEIERSQKQIAEREWQLLKDQAPKNNLALREPQLRSAQAALKAAKSGLGRSQLSVNRTTVRAPFNGIVYSKSVDLGQLVGPQAPIATLVGTDAFWVQVSVSVDRLQWMSIPDVAGASQGSPATVIQTVGNVTIRRPGRVIQLLGDLDPAGRMARILVEIPHPLDMAADESAATTSAGTAAEETKNPELPLLLGAYVQVDIQGAEMDGVIEVPREAVHGGDHVYVYNDGTLDIREIDIVWRRAETVLVSRGLAAGDEVIISPLGAPVQGMILRTKTVTDNKSATADQPAPVTPRAADATTPNQ